MNNMIQKHVYFTIYLLLFFIACSQDKLTNNNLFNNDLLQLLETEQLDKFYQSINKHNLTSVRDFFEQKSKAGYKFNYGVLVNADIISKENRELFKPDIKKISVFNNLANEGWCFMNTALYNIANTQFFDQFLEIDHLFQTNWEKREKSILAIVNPIIRSLRELIYEIRLGTSTTPNKIAALRKRHIQTLINLNDLEKVSNLYLELLSLYDFSKIEIVLNNKNGNKIHDYKKINLDKYISDIDFSSIKNSQFINNSQPSYGIYGSLSLALREKSGYQDLFYLDALFSLIDPFGKTVRYLELAVFRYDFHHDLVTIDPYSNHGTIMFDTKSNPAIKIKIFHNESIVNQRNELMPIVIRRFQDIDTKAISGMLIMDSLDLKQNIDLSDFTLVAKSRHSHNHQIAEIMRYNSEQVEVHTFFGPPRFYSKQSPYETKVYQDYLLYFESNKNF